MFTPLYLRCVTSSIALILTIFSLISSTTHFAYAIHADTIVQEDHNHPRIPDLRKHRDGLWLLESAQEERSQTYEPMFAGLDRSILGRAPPEPRELTREIPAFGSLDIEDGESQSWRLAFPSDKRSLGEEAIRNGDEEHEQHEFLKRQDSGSPHLLYITLCVCDQPSRKTLNESGDKPPSLRVNISDSRNPSNDANNKSTTADLGLGTMNYTMSSDAYITVEVDRNPDFKGVYNYSLTASVIGLSASYKDNNDSNNLTFLDSDNNSILVVSQNFSNSSLPEWQGWMNNTPPYSIFVYRPNDTAIIGIERSVCGLKNHAQIKGRWLNDEGSTNVQLSMTSSGGGQSKQQFYVKGLNASTDYRAIMAYDGNSTVWQYKEFQTKKGMPPFFLSRISLISSPDDNCAVIYDLPFCTDTAYAVPFNPSNNTWKENRTTLALLYDQQARNLYQNFSFSLAQIPCDTTSSAQYSLARNCSQCATAYKAWLCAVTIPRCQDNSAPPDQYSWLQKRGVSQPSSPLITNDNKSIDGDYNQNSHRTDLIQNTIKPGPWKEVLPCNYLCYNLVQSCPAALGFECPVGRWLNFSYGHPSGDPNNVTCNPGGVNGANVARVGMSFLGALLALTIVFVVN